MAYQSYNRVAPFDHLGDAGAGTVYQSPASYSQPWGHHDGDLSSPEIEMHEHTSRPGAPTHRASGNSQYSTTSTLFPSQGEPNGEHQSFLNDPINKIDHTFTTSSFVPYKDNTGRQLRHILIGSSSRFLVTAALCAGYLISTVVWRNKGVQSEDQKRVYNTISTGISICLSLNIASSFKDMALNMRWPILSSKKRSLEEIDLILHADSMTKLGKLALTAKSPAVILTCLLWLLINILAQAGVAVLSLTYSWDTDYSAVLKSDHPGNISVPNMDHFYPGPANKNPSEQDEEYTAHAYGGLAWDFKVDDIVNAPKYGDIYNNSAAMFFQDYSKNSLEYTFLNSPATTQGGFDTFSMYSDRTINVTYNCESHKVTANGNGTFSNITVGDGIGEVIVSHAVEESTSFFTNMPDNGTYLLNNQCDDNDRCSIVEAFEASATNPWYYKCNITVGKTTNDFSNDSWVSDDMAFLAASSIAQIGYTDETGQEVQIYPNGSHWGLPLHGNATDMGMTMSTFAIGAIGGASMYNPTKITQGIVPSQGSKLDVGHQYFFYTIIGLIMGCHLLFCTIVAVLANRVMVGPDGHLSMGLLLRPIADSLNGVSGGRKNNAYKDATKRTSAKYEKARDGRWILNMT
ncbi:hypothetical protein LOCC1_G002250 [Lachnellula occidentalis]|uniref:Uncharacterized protein n=1 Tax=Lachnellula occidentalis TaxID=215460 RepID=A0A8H8S8B1_9HELO|nr:hypothetical protein LOCC1_G002250 [Lachnellula occidentalis]